MAKRESSMYTLNTIGYEGTDIDTFVASLKSAGVSAIADVRAVAISRKPGFSKTRLRDRLENEGIKYLHFIDLGDPKPGRQAAREGRFAAFRAIYNEHLSTDAATNALDELQQFAHNNDVCLLCFERDPENCHRSIVADVLQERLDMRVEHLLSGGGVAVDVGIRDERSGSNPCQSSPSA
ncbi:conserved hypothetical protein [Aurantimonas manganoxydans SI85-9A1]|uniref:DUF488 domain-containing protein n=2 Tax=Aurantimonas manganoxydans TaxID=651183 RepID=Q1YK71_AURMS|nr:conserved hypothetical protein [Aurantimonas manganoxydans SI85-9A1]